MLKPRYLGCINPVITAMPTVFPNLHRNARPPNLHGVSPFANPADALWHLHSTLVNPASPPDEAWAAGREMVRILAREAPPVTRLKIPAKRRQAPFDVHERNCREPAGLV